MLNLLVNALQSLPAAPPGDRASSPEIKPDNLVTVRLFQRASSVCLEVEHNGAPISESSITHLFEPLHYRGVQAGGGHLGLAISKRIVEELGGHIEAERPTDGGARLRLLLPAVE